MSDEELVARLRAYEDYGEYDLLMESRPERLRNADGPAAADAIERLTRERDAAERKVERLRDALAKLLDVFERGEVGFPQHVEIRFAVRDLAIAALAL